MKTNNLDSNSIFIASHYLQNLEDHINLTMVSKKTKRNMELFKFNPISLDQQTIKMFPNVEIFHFYDENDDFIEGENIIKYCDWNERTLKTIQEINDEFQDKVIEFKRIVQSEEDIKKQKEIKQLQTPSKIKISKMNFCDFSSQQPNENDLKIQMETNDSNEIIDNSKFEQITSLTIPSTITFIDNNYLKRYCKLKRLTIPSTVKFISKNCIEKCSELTNLSIPLNKERIICGDRIICLKNFDDGVIYLPDTIKIINGQRKKKKYFKIPSFVSSLNDYSFEYTNNIRRLSIPRHLINSDWRILYDNFPKVETIVMNKMPRIYDPYLFKKLMGFEDLEEIIVPSDYEVKGDRLFKVSKGCLYSIKLPLTIKTINGKSVELQPLETFTIPPSVNKLSNYCFAYSNDLREIERTNQIEKIGKGCFDECKYDFYFYGFNYDIVYYPTIHNTYEERMKLTRIIGEENVKKLELWTALKCGDILCDLFYSEIKKDLSKFILFHDCPYHRKDIVFLIECSNGELFGFYHCSKIDSSCYRCSEYDELVEMWAGERSFHFHLQSRETLQPMKYEIINPSTGFSVDESDGDYKYICIGDISIEYCRYDFDVEIRYGKEKDFDYHGTIPSNHWGSRKLYPKRFIVIQMS